MCRKIRYDGEFQKRFGFWGKLQSLVACIYTTPPETAIAIHVMIAIDRASRRVISSTLTHSTPRVFVTSTRRRSCLLLLFFLLDDAETGRTGINTYSRRPSWPRCCCDFDDAPLRKRNGGKTIFIYTGIGKRCYIPSVPGPRSSKQASATQGRKGNILRAYVVYESLADMHGD
jgi:hypothetical protein